MTDPIRHAADVHLLILTRGSHGPLSPDAPGLASLTRLTEAEVLAALPGAPIALVADRGAHFRAAAPAAIARHLAALPAGDLLLVEIAEDAGPLPPLPGEAAIAALAAAAGGARAGFVHGQALPWPQEHHVGSDCLVLLDAEGPDMLAAPLIWPSPAVYAPNPACLSFLHLWAEYATDARLSLARPDTLRPSSELLRGHEMGWAIGSVLAHKAEAAHFAAADEAPPLALEAALADATLTLAAAGDWLAEGALAARRAAARPAPALLLRQLEQMLAATGGRICRDHLEALMAETRSADPLHAILLDERLRGSDKLWSGLGAEVNLIWTERQLDGLPTARADMCPILREALRRTLDGADHLAMILQSNLAWQLIGSDGRSRFRGVHGPFVSSSGRDAMRRFVDSLDQPFRSALIESPPAELREALTPELRQRLEAWLLVAG